MKNIEFSPRVSPECLRLSIMPYENKRHWQIEQNYSFVVWAFDREVFGVLRDIISPALVGRE